MAAQNPVELINKLRISFTTEIPQRILWVILKHTDPIFSSPIFLPNPNFPLYFKNFPKLKIFKQSM